jgi:hypothetical protein
LEDDYKSIQHERSRKKARMKSKKFIDHKPAPNLRFKPRTRPNNPNPNRKILTPKAKTFIVTMTRKGIMLLNADNPKLFGIVVDNLVI